VSSLSSSPIFCLMGPTASGKTQLAAQLVKRFPCEIISVDSAMVYRGMDIGTAKPTPDILAAAPHRLINLLDPKESYSAGQFRTDALREIEDIIAHGKIPLLAGGTMLYFRVLQQGIAKLPQADMHLRTELKMRAEQEGWEALHAFLGSVDPLSARRIERRDSQRIQRALEVYLLTGKPMSVWQAEETSPLSGYQLYSLALVPSDRLQLHERIAKRFLHMLDLGFMDEVERLYARQDLTPDLPSIRSVGYRQAWDYFSGQLNFNEMKESAIAATRQLAKRQMTWLRSWKNVTSFDADSHHVLDQTTMWLEKHLNHL
jgi:tRNA dimethylallyltransferase